MARIFLCILLVLTIAGCGYTTGSLLPSKYRKIAIQPFENKVNNIDENSQGMLYVPLLETNVRTAIIDRFLFDGNLHIADPDKADLVLSGDLIGIAQDDLRQDVNQNVQEYRIRIIVSLTLTDSGHRQGPLERTFFYRGDDIFSHRDPGHIAERCDRRRADRPCHPCC